LRVCLGLAFYVFFLIYSLDYFVLVLFALVVLRLVSSVLCQEIGWEERLYMCRVGYEISTHQSTYIHPQNIWSPAAMQNGWPTYT